MAGEPGLALELEPAESASGLAPDTGWPSHFRSAHPLVTEGALPIPELSESALVLSHLPPTQMLMPRGFQGHMGALSLVLF